MFKEQSSQMWVFIPRPRAWTALTYVWSSGSRSQFSSVRTGISNRKPHRLDLKWSWNKSSCPDTKNTECSNQVPFSSRISCRCCEQTQSWRREELSLQKTLQQQQWLPTQQWRCILGREGVEQVAVLLTIPLSQVDLEDHSLSGSSL